MNQLSRTKAWLSCLLAAAFFGACKSKSTSESASGNAAASAQEEQILEQKPQEFPKAPLVVGEVVYDFAALAHTGQALKLSDFKERPSLVYFCSQDKAAPCTALAASVRDAWTQLHSHIDMAFGVSPEPSIVHDDFASEQHLPFLMLSDGDGTIHKVFGIQPGTVTSYLVGTDRKILHVFAPPNPAAHGTEVLNTLTALGLKRQEYPM